MTKTLLLVILAGAAAACSTAFAAPETGQVGKPLELGGTKVDEQPMSSVEPPGSIGHVKTWCVTTQKYGPGRIRLESVKIAGCVAGREALLAIAYLV
jgi:hypothetical protein